MVNRKAPGQGPLSVLHSKRVYLLLYPVLSGHRRRRKGEFRVGKTRRKQRAEGQPVTSWVPPDWPPEPPTPAEESVTSDLIENTAQPAKVSAKGPAPGPRPPSHLRPRLAAEASGTSQASIYRLIKDGKIDARKFGRTTLVNMASLDAYIASLPKA
jgi:excisionase family DNA binding protein